MGEALARERTVIPAREILSAMRRAIVANASALAVSSGICVVPAGLLGVAAQALLPDARDATGAVALAVHLLAVHVAYAAATRITLEYLGGGECAALPALRAAASRVLPVLAIGLPLMLATFFGLLLLVVPGILVVVTFIAACPAVMGEQLGPLKAMQRSRELTRGSHFQIFLALLAVAAIALNGLLCVCLSMACYQLISGPEEASPVFRFVSLAVNLGGQSVLIVGAATCGAAVYSCARARERVDVAEMNDVFS